MLRDEQGIAVIGEASSGEEAIEQVRKGPVEMSFYGHPHARHRRH